MSDMVTCPTCDGTCEVHSHNKHCPDCNLGTVTKERANELRQRDERIRLAIPARTWDYQ